MNLNYNNLTITLLYVYKCLLCVFVYSRFIENPLVDLEVSKPSFLRWFCHGSEGSNPNAHTRGGIFGAGCRAMARGFDMLSMGILGGMGDV
jgi:hypothetical protein